MSANGILRVAVVYPDLLGTYGDGGNGLILARRADWRGVSVELVQAESDAAVPEADIYCVGGGEDGPQVRAAGALREDGTLARRVAEGAVVLAVCAGYQIVGRTFPGADGTPHEGVGLLDVHTVKGAGARAVGELVADPADDVGGDVDGGRAATLPTLTGFENHAAVTTLGPGVQPLARVRRGVGNGDGAGTEGARAGRVIGTYLHGPVLARNPALADLLLAWALDLHPTALASLDDGSAEVLREERFRAVGGRGRWRRRRDPLRSRA